MACHSRDGRAIEEVGIVLKRRGEPSSDLRGHQRYIELSYPLLNGERLKHEPAQVQSNGGITERE